MTRRILIGIAGGSGSGKTLVARTIVRELGSSRVVIIDQDSYYKDLDDIPFRDREARNFDHPDAFDNELLKRHVRDLIEGRAIEQPIYDYAEHRRSPETRHIGEHVVIVLEGILIFVDPELRALMDIKLFIDADPDVRFIRRLRRDLVERGRSVDSIIRQYEESVRPMHMQFVEPSKRYADLIIPEGGHNKVAIDLVKTKIRDLLRERVPAESART
ncbi:MAG: uridine kinase [Candidatus Eisenbacteria bacterium]|uniref:Uridine kinase n=1 Tax=Eiseniibacteriota bacterium TaxID=2212470 RepID=A0A9D6QJQ2_UNCEI|nr:uridine kinase [Candidatus Eisenbacteria bacterium]MBI3539495.1 uridine kinase [Candidatus Eisenbacteria bacterium]